MKDIGADGFPTDDNHPFQQLERTPPRVLLQTHPDSLRRSRIPLTIVCGPPCSGKTTYVTENSRAGGRFIDLDIIRKRLQPDYQ